MKRCKIILCLLLGLFALLAGLWLFLPSAAQATGLDDYAAHGVHRVVLIPRPGSGDPQREITAPEEINDILDWFSGVKVRPALVRYGGSSLALIFYAPDAAEPLRVNVVRDICYHFSSAGHDASAGLLLAGLRDVWAPFPSS